MPLSRSLAAAAGIAAIALASSSPLLARPGGWGSPDPWSRDPWARSDGFGRSAISRDAGRDREGKVEVARFVAEDAKGLLGQGSIGVVPAKGEEEDGEVPAAFEAAVIDRLVAAGYDTQGPAGSESQLAELHIAKSVVVPQEAPHKPVSGEMTMGVSNHGSMMGMGLNIDLTKPKKALISTRLEARIRDRESGKVLWEGRADIATREGDSDWTDQAIAHKLADALFKGFPADAGQVVAMR